MTLALFLFSFTAEAQNLPLHSKVYDTSFETYSEMFMPGRDWRLLKAQCYQESLFNPDARSYVGAAGLCQFMPATWKDEENVLNRKGSAYDPDLNILFAAHYMMRMKRIFRAETELVNQESFAMAGYNAGAGNILKAKKKCPAGSAWNTVLFDCLPLVTGKHAKETQTYVTRIWGFFDRLKKLG